MSTVRCVLPLALRPCNRSAVTGTCAGVYFTLCVVFVRIPTRYSLGLCRIFLFVLILFVYSGIYWCSAYMGDWRYQPRVAYMGTVLEPGWEELFSLVLTVILIVYGLGMSGLTGVWC